MPWGTSTSSCVLATLALALPSSRLFFTNLPHLCSKTNTDADAPQVILRTDRDGNADADGLNAITAVASQMKLG